MEAVLSEDNPGGDLQKYIDWAIANKKMADNYGLGLVAYEGGSGYLDMTGNHDLENLYARANMDARMSTLIRRSSPSGSRRPGAPFSINSTMSANIQFTDLGGHCRTSWIPIHRSTIRW